MTLGGCRWLDLGSQKIISIRALSTGVLEISTSQMELFGCFPKPRNSQCIYLKALSALYVPFVLLELNAKENNAFPHLQAEAKRHQES